MLVLWFYRRFAHYFELIYIFNNRLRVKIVTIYNPNIKETQPTEDIKVSNQMRYSLQFEEDLKEENKRLNFPSDILDRFKIKVSKFHWKLTHIEYFGNLVLVAIIS